MDESVAVVPMPEGERREIDRILCHLESFASQAMYPACEREAHQLLLAVDRDLSKERRLLHGAHSTPEDLKTSADLQESEQRAILGLVKTALTATHRRDPLQILGAAADVRDAFALHEAHEQARLGLNPSR